MDYLTIQVEALREDLKQSESDISAIASPDIGSTIRNLVRMISKIASDEGIKLQDWDYRRSAKILDLRFDRPISAGVLKVIHLMAKKYQIGIAVNPPG